MKKKKKNPPNSFYETRLILIPKPHIKKKNTGPFSLKNADTDILTKILAYKMQLASVLGHVPWIDRGRNIHAKGF